MSIIREHSLEYLSKKEQRYFLLGLEKGIWQFAWWKDGIQYVGTCGKLLKDIIKPIQNEIEELEKHIKLEGENLNPDKEGK